MAECLLLALSGQFGRTRICPLSDNSGQRSALALNGSVVNDPIRTLGDGASPSFSTLNATKKARSILDLGRNLANEERYHSHNREGDADYHA